LIVSLIKEKCQQIFSSLPAQYKIIMEEEEEEEEDGTK